MSQYLKAYNPRVLASQRTSNASWNFHKLFLGPRLEFSVVSSFAVPQTPEATTSSTKSLFVFLFYPPPTPTPPNNRRFSDEQVENPA